MDVGEPMETPDIRIEPLWNPVPEPVTLPSEPGPSITEPVKEPDKAPA